MAEKMIFTSGTQALQERTVNHDPYPWKFYRDWDGYNPQIGSPYTYRVRYPGEWRLAPHPMYAVHDNPVLGYFRREVERYGNPAQGNYLAWLEGVHPGMRLGATGETVTPQHITHAHRVLTRLEA